MIAAIGDRCDGSCPVSVVAGRRVATPCDLGSADAVRDRGGYGVVAVSGRGVGAI